MDVKNVKVVLNNNTSPVVLRWQNAMMASSNGAKQCSMTLGKRYWKRVVGGIVKRSVGCKESVVMAGWTVCCDLVASILHKRPLNCFGKRFQRVDARVSMTPRNGMAASGQGIDVRASGTGSVGKLQSSIVQWVQPEEDRRPLDISLTCYSSISMHIGIDSNKLTGTTVSTLYQGYSTPGPDSTASVKFNNKWNNKLILAPAKTPNIHCLWHTAWIPQRTNYTTYRTVTVLYCSMLWRATSLQCCTIYIPVPNHYCFHWMHEIVWTWIRQYSCLFCVSFRQSDFSITYTCLLHPHRNGVTVLFCILSNTL